MVKKVISRTVGTGTGSATSCIAVKIAGMGAKRVGAAVITHGLKVLGLGSMGLGIAATAGIGIVIGLGVVALLDELFD
jgi:hypothetical protein